MCIHDDFISTNTVDIDTILDIIKTKSFNMLKFYTHNWSIANSLLKVTNKVFKQHCSLLF